ncbi:MAG TPA: DUF6111 family protein [Azospirillaceae bacterium]|nr:DUF6111 family protein [Azospirillaceae bacterium]
MIRVLQVVALLVLPTLVYIAYSTWQQRRRAAAGQAPLPWYVEAPWHWLAAAGVLLALTVLGAVAVTGGAEPHGTYVPARVGEDGRVVPAETLPAQTAPGETAPAGAERPARD